MAQQKIKTIKQYMGTVLSVSLFVALLLGVFPQVAYGYTNLLVNPGAETDSTNGWTSTGSWAYNWNNAHSGDYSFDSTYYLSTLTQQVNLYTSGYSQSELDNNQPPITFSVWVATRCDQAGQYFLNFQLLGADDSTVIASSGSTFGTSGSLDQLSACTAWTQKTYTFNNYGSGAEYAVFELGGRDKSGWAGYYGTDFDDASLTVNNDTPPDSPSVLGSTSEINGSWINSNQPTLSFNLSDSNSDDTVQYQIQIDTHSDFSSPVVDYVSALGSQGATSFSVGQPPGSGNYLFGSQGQQLADGSYYWRVLAENNNNLTSSYTVANSNNVAFIVDTTPPTTPGTPTTNVSSTTNSSPSWTWSASTDSGSGLAATPYTIEWSQDSSFNSGVSSSTSSTNSFTPSNALSPGTWYFRVKAMDAAGNYSAYSPSGTIVIESSKPSSPPSNNKTSIPLLDVITSSNNSTSEDLLDNTPSTASPSSSQPILLNSYSTYTSGSGKVLQLGVNQLVDFKVNSTLHTATVTNVGGDFAILTIHSNPITFKLNVGATKQVAVNHDGKPNIMITLKSINNGVAVLSFAQVKSKGIHLSSDVGSTTKSNTYTYAAIGVVSCGLLWSIYIKRARSYKN